MDGCRRSAIAMCHVDELIIWMRMLDAASDIKLNVKVLCILCFQHHMQIANWMQMAWRVGGGGLWDRIIWIFKQSTHENVNKKPLYMQTS